MQSGWQWRKTFFFNDTATTEIYTLSLHDALPIYSWVWGKYGSFVDHLLNRLTNISVFPGGHSSQNCRAQAHGFRSEEHTSELQSHLNLVCRLLLEKKKKRQTHNKQHK